MDKRIQELSDSYSFLAYESDNESNKSFIGTHIFDTNNEDWINIPPDALENKELESPVELDQHELSHRLTSLVRKQYLNFLKSILRNTYESHWNDDDKLRKAPSFIEKYAEHLEQAALKSCMIVSLYRKSMLKIIAEIRGDSTKKTKLKEIYQYESTLASKNAEKIDRQSQTDQLYPNDQSKAKIFSNAKVQTDALECLRNLRPYTKSEPDSLSVSLDEKLRKFEMKLKEEERKRKQFSNFLAKKEFEEMQKEKYAKKFKYSNSDDVLATPTTPVTPIQIPSVKEKPPEIPSALLTPVNIPPLSETENDNIAKELQAMFGPEEDNILDIFSESIQNPQIDAIISEINNSDVPRMDAAATAETNPCSNGMNEMTDEIMIQDETQLVPVTSVIDSMVDQQTFDMELRESLWPCELHMQRLQLRKTLNAIADKGLRYNEKIRQKFILLFGDDGVDEDIGPYSPSIEIDEILIASCKRRIAPWIVKYLMKPMNDGLIANRHLFKKLAKHIAETVIYIDQYPDEQMIEMAVSEYFSTHPCVGSINDIN